MQFQQNIISCTLYGTLFHFFLHCCQKYSEKTIYIQNTLFIVFQKTKGLDHWKENTIKVMEGSPIVLPCNHFYSVPMATLTWYTVKCLDCHDKRLVDLDDRVTMDEYGEEILK